MAKHVDSESLRYDSDETRSKAARSLRYGSDETRSKSARSLRYGSDETRSKPARSLRYGSDESRSMYSNTLRYGSDESRSMYSNTLRYGSDESRSVYSNTLRYGSDESRSKAARSLRYGSDEIESMDSNSFRYGSDEVTSIDSRALSSGSDETRSTYAVGNRETQEKGKHSLSCVHEICDVHEGEFIAFYCANHNESGCSMCMKMGHSSCKNVHSRRSNAVNKITKQFERMATDDGNVGGKSANITNKRDGTVGGNPVSMTTKRGVEEGKRSTRMETKVDGKEGGEVASNASKLDNEVVGKLKIQRNDGEVAGARSKPRHLYSVTGSRDINVRIEGDRTTCDILDICQLPDGRLLMTDLINDKLKLLDQSYTVIDHCAMHWMPTSVCVCDEEACVGPWRSKTLQFVSLQEKIEISRTMKLDHECVGLVYRDGELYVADGEANIHVYNKAGNKLRVYKIDTVVCKGFRDEYLTVSMDGRQLYMTRGEYLTCLDIQSGEVIWSVRGDNGGEYRGVCVDDDNNVMVCDSGRDEIVQYSGDGERLGVIVDGLVWPMSICFDQDSKTLCVGIYYSDVIKMFNLY